MGYQDALQIATFVMSTVAVIMASLPFLPQLKRAFVIVRDLVLWATLIGILVYVATIGWTRYVESHGRRGDAGAPDSAIVFTRDHSFPR